MPPSDPPSVGSPDHVLIDFPLDGWSFHATFQPAGQRRGRMQTVPLHRTVQGSFVSRHAGHAGIYDVTLFGRGSGDLVTVFRWSTPSDGPLPVPKSRLASWPATMDSSTATASSSRHQIRPRPPAAATAKSTATAANGASTTFEATRSRQRCQPDGTLYWDGPRRPRVGRCSPWPGSLHIQSGAEPRRQAPRGYGRLARRRDQGKRTLGHAQLHSRPPGTRVKRDPGTTAAISGNTPVRKRRS